MSERDESTGQFTPSEPLTGRAAEEHAAGFTPMVDEPTPESEELSKKEAAERLAELSSSKPIATHILSANLPADVTMTIEQGAAALADSRAADKAQAELDETEKLQKEVDQLRGETPEAKPASVETDEETLEKALAHPRVKEALERQITEAETTRSTYSKGLDVANQFAQAAFAEGFPEIASLPIEQWENALRAMHAREPERFNKAMGTLSRVAQLQNAAQHEQQQRSAREAAEFQTYAKGEDARFNEMVKGERNMAAVEAQIPATLKSLGVDPAEFLKAGTESKFLRSAAAQAVLVKAAKYDLLMAAPRAVPTKAAPPPVQRPGTTASRGERSVANFSTLNSKLSQSGSQKDAFQLLMAKRGKR
jgi:hypothetical protein